MAAPLACFIRISVKGEAAREAAPVWIKSESKSAFAARLYPPAGENVPAHRAGDGAVLSIISSVDAAHLIPRARKLQRSIMGQVLAREISAWSDWCSARRSGATRRRYGDFESETVLSVPGSQGYYDHKVVPGITK